jgi:hypothetical protein
LSKFKGGHLDILAFHEISRCSIKKLLHTDLSLPNPESPHELTFGLMRCFDVLVFDTRNESVAIFPYYS